METEVPKGPYDRPNGVEWRVELGTELEAVQSCRQAG